MLSADETEARLAAIVASSDDAIVSKDLNGTIMSWNRAAERMFGFSSEEAIGQSIHLIIPDDRRGEEAFVIGRIRAGLGVDHYETVRMRKDGTPIDVSLTVSPIVTHGVVVGASKIARDITAQRRLQVQADEASRLKDEFLAVLSHELRTPLNTVLGYARILRGESARTDGALRERALETLERNADMLTRLVNDLLDTSSIVTGTLRLTTEVCAIDQSVAAAVDVVRLAADAKGVTIRMDMDTGLTVVGDRARLQQVVWNLASNAIKFTPPGGTVTVRVGRVGSNVEIALRDTGIGMTAAQLPYVFQRFWQAHTGASREYGGLGIGLALARHLVELHGGTIAAESAGPDQGSTFIVRLPLAADTRLRAVK